MGPSLLALVLAASSSSFLGVQVQGDDETSRALLAPCPPLAVFPLLIGTAPAAQITAFRQACPGAAVVAQLQGSADGVNAFFVQWTAWLPQLLAIGSSQLDGVEGPPHSPATADALTAFWTTFVQQVSGSGFFPVVDASALAFRSGAADGGSEDGFCATARALRTGGTSWGWSWHAVSPTTSTDAQLESTTTLGYRAVRDSCALSGIRLFVTELRPQIRPWQASDLDWLAWVDGQLSVDAARSDLRGAALFEAGAAGPFDLTPISGGLAAYFANPTPSDGGTDGGPIDGGTDGGDGGTDAGVDGGGGIAGPVVPIDGPLGPPQPSSCSCSTPGAGAVVLAALLLGLRRRHGVKR